MQQMFEEDEGNTPIKSGTRNTRDFCFFSLLKFLQRKRDGDGMAKETVLIMINETVESG